MKSQRDMLRGVCVDIVLEKAVMWWLDHKPPAQSLGWFLRHPTCGMRSDAEMALAEAVAETIAQDHKRWRRMAEEYSQAGQAPQ
jgi:hypothetical protein